MLALCTDGLIGFPGVDIEDALADLGEVFADGDDESLESLADRLIRDMSAEERPDDVTLLFLRARTAS